MLLASGVATAAPEASRPLVVGTVPIAPFIVKQPDGSWGGISMDLWKLVAERAHLTYEVRELSIADLKDPAKLAQLDAFVSLNVTAEREATMDFTHAFYSTGLAIAVAPKPDDGLGATLRAIFTPKFGKLIAALFALLLAVGTVMWLVERRRNAAQFGGPAAKGIGAGLWWSAVTMTTVGYGDKAPVTLLGRMLGLVWMFAAIIIISSFTAAIASALTVDQLASSISGPDDLPNVKVGTVEPSAGAKYLTARRIRYQGFPDPAAAVDALATGKVDAVVYEAPILAYHVHQHDAGIVVLDGTFDNHGYAFALAQGSPHREAINIAMLQIVASDEWQAILARYLGP
ncbi:MAG TPA: transporter substrate-binding domain-containing protein [Kofleriaceae bacterium]|nr:transporter substrate-binding domain-containing protein [Kofleriaceae bacterium]